MTQCWSEGTLRAYLDRELPSEEMQRVAAHLGECTVCDGLCTELAGAGGARLGADGIASRVDCARATPGGSAGQDGRIGSALRWLWQRAWRWPPTWLPNRRSREVAVAAPPAIAPAPAVAFAPPPVATVVADTDPMPVERPAPRRVRRVRQAAPDTAYFVALDDEPFESGVIMRMDVKPGKVQADIVFGPDGRAHAFRLVNASQRNF